MAFAKYSVILRHYAKIVTAKSDLLREVERGFMGLLPDT